ncbi:MAG: lipopolysaccharide biosynthesis protein [Coriobacteriales bacterium]
MESRPEPLDIKRNMLFNTIGSLTYQGCLWVTTVLVVILSDGYTDSGILSFAMTVGNMFTAIGTYSMRTYQVSDVRNKYSQATYVGFRLLTLVIGLGILSVYSFLVCPDSQTFIAVIAFLIFKIDEGFCDVLYGVDQRGERMDYIGISQFIRGLLVVLAFSAGMMLTQDIVIAILLMVPAGLLITFCWDIPHSKRIVDIRPRLSKQDAKELLTSCLPLVAETLFLGMIVSVARQYFANAYGNDQLGIYATIATPAVLVQAAARYLYAPVLVPLSEKWDESPKKAFLPYFKRTLAIMMTGILIAIPLLSLVGSWALDLVYGERVSGYTYLFTNVLISTSTLTLLYYLTDVLVLCRDIKGSLIVASISLIMTLALMVPLEAAFFMQGINYVVILATSVGIVVASVRLRSNKQLRRNSQAPQQKP